MTPILGWDGQCCSEHSRFISTLKSLDYYESLIPLSVFIFMPRSCLQKTNYVPTTKVESCHSTRRKKTTGSWGQRLKTVTQILLAIIIAATSCRHAPIVYPYPLIQLMRLNVFHNSLWLMDLGCSHFIT